MTTSKCHVLWICQADGTSLEENDKILSAMKQIWNLNNKKKINKYLLCGNVLCGWL